MLYNMGLSSEFSGNFRRLFLYANTISGQFAIKCDLKLSYLSGRAYLNSWRAFISYLSMLVFSSTFYFFVSLFLSGGATLLSIYYYFFSSSSSGFFFFLPPPIGITSFFSSSIFFMGSSYTSYPSDRASAAANSKSFSSYYSICFSISLSLSSYSYASASYLTASLSYLLGEWILLASRICIIFASLFSSTRVPKSSSSASITYYSGSIAIVSRSRLLDPSGIDENGRGVGSFTTSAGGCYTIGGAIYCCWLNA